MGSVRIITQTTHYGYLPLHHILATTRSSIRGFQFVFEYGIRYYPEKKGINLMFRKNPYTRIHPSNNLLVKTKFGYEKVMKVVEDTLTRYSARRCTTIKYCGGITIGSY
jgi:hypothetical protein